LLFPLRPPTLLVHWAGQMEPGAIRRRATVVAQALGLPLPPAKIFSHRRLWRHYRYLG
jgi:hypothetical protein